MNYQGSFGKFSQRWLSSVANKTKMLTAETMNPHILNAEYAVRGSIVLKSLEFQKQLDEKRGNLPFDKIIACNIGNPQALGQKPITFNRQVLALVNAPELLNKNIFPEDVVGRARTYLAHIPGGTGAYSHSKGVEYLRNEVAKFIERRDSFPANPEDIFLTDGASQGVQTILRALIRDENDGIMVPIPQYPLYSAGIALNGGKMVEYFLDEKSNWGLDVEELKQSIQRSRDQGVNVRALVVINPGNPTGQCLDECNMKKIIEFCRDECLLLMADEVYQENVYSEGKQFTSFKKVLSAMGEDYNGVQLISFHSTSKGYLGECGRRGGYMEMVGICNTAKEQLYKLASVSLCSNIEGQIMVGLMTNPPVEGEISYELYKQERDTILESLKRRAVKLVDAFNKLEGVTCNETEGALYAFPRISLPKKAVRKATEDGVAPDALYCMELLENTGIVVVPGSGFGQVDGTWHFRTTILPDELEIDSVIEKCSDFHAKFMKKYAD